MSKVKIKLKLQGLELEVEAERADIPAITRGITQQLSGILHAPGTIIGVEPHDIPNRAPQLSSPIEVKNGKQTKRRRSSSTGETSNAPIDFRHDAAKYGTPTQEWNTAQKAMWLLYAVGKQTEHKELSKSDITDTFNKHFRQAKTIQQGNVGRDLGKAKIQPLAPVGEDTSKTPPVWYLTEEGEKLVLKLINAKNEVTQPVS